MVIESRTARALGHLVGGTPEGRSEQFGAREAAASRSRVDRGAPGHQLGRPVGWLVDLLRFFIDPPDDPAWETLAPPRPSGPTHP